MEYLMDINNLHGGSDLSYNPAARSENGIDLDWVDGISLHIDGVNVAIDEPIFSTDAISVWKMWDLCH
jgi:hypothetical protein